MMLPSKMKSEDEAAPPENDTDRTSSNVLSLLLISFAAVTFVESYGELVMPKHEHVQDYKSSKFLIRAMRTIDDEMSPTRCHDMLSNCTMIVT
jgi:hypothetical protein